MDGADTRPESTMGGSPALNEKLPAGLPTSLARLARMLGQRGVPVFIDADGESVLATLLEGEVLYTLTAGLDSISFRSLWSRGFSSARYRDAANVCNEWNSVAAWTKAYASEPSAEEDRAVRVFSVGQIMWDEREDVFGARLDDSLNTIQVFYAWLGEQYPDPIRIPSGPYGKRG